MTKKYTKKRRNTKISAKSLKIKRRNIKGGHFLSFLNKKKTNIESNREKIDRELATFIKFSEDRYNFLLEYKTKKEKQDDTIKIMIQKNKDNAEIIEEWKELQDEIDIHHINVKETQLVQKQSDAYNIGNPNI